MPDYRSIYEPYARQFARQYGVPEDLYVWQIGQESSWNPYAANPSSTARGIAQITAGTASDLGVDVWDPIASLEAGARYMAQRYDWAGGSWEGALRGYGTTAHMTSYPSELQNILGNLGSSPYNGGTAINVDNPLDLIPWNSTPGLVIDNATLDALNRPRTVEGVLDDITNSIGAVLTRIGIAVLGMVFVAGGLYLFGTGKTPVVIEQVSRDVNRSVKKRVKG